MTFTLADAQAERIKSAMKDVEVKDGTKYGNEKDKKTLAEILLIIYAITTETVSENTEGVC